MNSKMPKYALSLEHHWKCNFPMNPNVGRSVGLLVSWLVCVS